MYTETRKMKNKIAIIILSIIGLATAVLANLRYFFDYMYVGGLWHSYYELRFEIPEPVQLLGTWIELAPFILLLIYFTSCYQKNKGKALLPLSFALLAANPFWIFITDLYFFSNSGMDIDVIINTLYLQDSQLVYTVLDIAAIALFIVCAVNAFKKSIKVLLPIASGVMILQTAMYFKNYIEILPDYVDHEFYFYIVIYFISYISTLILSCVLILFAVGNGGDESIPTQPVADPAWSVPTQQPVWNDVNQQPTKNELPKEPEYNAPAPEYTWEAPAYYPLQEESTPDSVADVSEDTKENVFCIPAGTTVTHVRLGEGRVVNTDVAQKSVTVDFGGEKVTFEYPKCFENGFMTIKWS